MNSIIRAASRLALRPRRDHILGVVPLANNKFAAINKRWASNFPLTYDMARERIMLVLHLYDKIDPNKLTLDSHFINDLGLDSLDHIDIIMQLEDEFMFEIPDQDIENLLRPSDIIRYITDKEEAYEELQQLQAHDHHHHHGHDDHKHGTHNESLSHGETPKLNATQKREFSSWSKIARRYMSSDDGEKKKVYRTSFNEVPVKEINYDDIQARVMKVLSKYDKIDSSQLHAASHLVDDLGLDSLDHVEIMMELEDEFALEIPDAEAEKLMRPTEIARFIFKIEEGRAMVPEDREY